MEVLHCAVLKTSQMEKINLPKNVMLVQHSWKFHPTLNKSQCSENSHSVLEDEIKIHTAGKVHCHPGVSSPWGKCSLF